MSVNIIVSFTKFKFSGTFNDIYIFIYINKIKIRYFFQQFCGYPTATFEPTPSALEIIALSPDEIAKINSSTVSAERIESAALGPTLEQIVIT